jgi:hypothetical protein
LTSFSEQKHRRFENKTAPKFARKNRRFENETACFFVKAPYSLGQKTGGNENKCFSFPPVFQTMDREDFLLIKAQKKFFGRSRHDVTAMPRECHGYVTKKLLFKRRDIEKL